MLLQSESPYTLVTIDDDTTGYAEEPTLGETTTITLGDENGNDIERTGVVTEILN